MTKTTFHCFRKNLAANRVGGNCQIGAEKMVRHVMGRIHQGIEKFCPFNGLQCTAIAFLALVVLSGMSRDRPQTWVNDVTSSDIDNLYFSKRRYIVVRIYCQSTGCFGISYTQ